MSKIQANLNLSDNVELMFYKTSRLAEETISEIRGMEPDHTVTKHNVLTKTYREHLAKAVNPNQNTSSFEASHIAFGDDDTAANISDTHLKNELYRRSIDQKDTFGTEFNCITLLTANDANGDNLVEWALVTEADPSNAEDRAINRVVVDDDRVKPKTDEWAIAARVNINFKDISEI